MRRSVMRFSQNTMGTISFNSVPQRVKDMQYAVRGEVVNRSFQLEKNLKEHPEKYSFSKLVPANIGNPQAVGATPIDYYRQLLSLMINPELIDVLGQSYPADVVSRAKQYVKNGVKCGAYSHSKGYEILRQDVCEWLEKRDGYKASSEDIYLTDGASTAVKTVLELLIDDKNDAILIPIPQYPLYSATITKMNGTWLGYNLNEKNGWSLSFEELEKTIKDAKEKKLRIKAIAVINPGNPTGSILSKSDIEKVIKLAEKEKFAILADEVYQENIYSETQQFIPFRKILKDLKSKIELFSFHSASKGLAGECGIRGGLVHCENLNNSISELLYKLFSVSLCSNTMGQILMACICKGPTEKDASFVHFANDKMERLISLKNRAKLVSDRFNKMKGVECQEVVGAMYAFPKICLPQKAIEEAKTLNMHPDMFYCIQLLEHTGVVVVPGSGFGQKEGTYHYRMTILPQENELPEVMNRIEKFHNLFLEKYE